MYYQFDGQRDFTGRNLNNNTLRDMFMADFLDRLSMIHPKIGKLIQDATGRSKRNAGRFSIRPFYLERPK
jgi:hypothetical protein